MHGRNLKKRLTVSVAGAAVATAAALAASPASAAPGEAAAPERAKAPAAAPAEATQESAGSKQQTVGAASVRPHTASAHPGLAEDVDYDKWQRDVSAVTDEARPYLEERISKGKDEGEKMAIVLDIDNTSLETHFHPIWELPTPAVKQTLDLAQYADSEDVAVYFVTARPGIIRSVTEDNLEEEDFPITGLYVRDLPDIFDEVSKYKTAKRAEIESKGYTIIANIGNTPTDIVGGHAEKTFKLPDYDGALS